MEKKRTQFRNSEPTLAREIVSQLQNGSVHVVGASYSGLYREGDVSGEERTEPSEI